MATKPAQWLTTVTTHLLLAILVNVKLVDWLLVAVVHQSP